VPDHHLAIPLPERQGGTRAARGQQLLTYKQLFPYGPYRPEFGIAALVLRYRASSTLALIVRVRRAGHRRVPLRTTRPGGWHDSLQAIDLLAAVTSLSSGSGRYSPDPVNPSPAGCTLFRWIPLFGGVARTVIPSCSARSCGPSWCCPSSPRCPAGVSGRRRHQREAALALGATQWEMIRLFGLPYCPSLV